MSINVRVSGDIRYSSELTNLVDAQIRAVDETASPPVPIAPDPVLVDIRRTNRSGSVPIDVMTAGEDDQINGRAIIEIPGVMIEVDAEELIRALKPFLMTL